MSAYNCERGTISAFVDLKYYQERWVEGGSLRTTGLDEGMAWGSNEWMRLIGRLVAVLFSCPVERRETTC